MGGKPKTSTAPDMRKGENREKYKTVENRDKTAPRGKANLGKQPMQSSPPKTNK